MNAALASTNISLTWSDSAIDDQRFRRIVTVCVAMALLLSIILPLIPLPEHDRIEAFECAGRTTRLGLPDAEDLPVFAETLEI